MEADPERNEQPESRQEAYNPSFNSKTHDVESNLKKENQNIRKSLIDFPSYFNKGDASQYQSFVDGASPR